MPYLRESVEWRLIQQIAAELSQRKAQYVYRENAVNGHVPVDIDADKLEVELRQIFRRQEIIRYMSPTEFKHCQAALKNLCLFLESLTWHRSTSGDIEGQEYTRLRASIGVLKSTSEAIDLINGPNKRLFRLPNNAASLCDCLRLVTKCNKTLSGLLAPPPSESAIRSPQIQREKEAVGKNSTIRDHATRVLECLFNSFRCGIPHEVLLKIVENRNEDLIVSGLHLMLSSCPETESWQEVQYDSNVSDNASALVISDICSNIHQNMEPEKVLKLKIKEHELYGAWTSPISARLCPPFPESLEQFIEVGAFERLDINALRDETASIKFSTTDKRRLAVKLGYCLMDFFDANFTSKKIYFLGSSIQHSKETPYLAFGPQFPLTNGSYNQYDFKMGHPTLLSFAKLLLEVEFGQIIEFTVSPDSSRNRNTWFKLLEYVDILERDKSDSYILAIRNCLFVYRDIAMKLKISDKPRTKAKNRDKMIRKIIHRQIVQKLELGLAESIPRPSHKRRRSDPTPTVDLSDSNQSADLSEMAIRPAEFQPMPLDSKRRRTFDSSQLSFESSVKEQNGLLKNDFRSLDAMISYKTPRRREDFEIALICALTEESNAVEALFDDYFEQDSSYGKAPEDQNAYTVGRMAGHNVVLAFMPGMGKVNSASTAAGVRASFPNIKLGVVVGICGGVPGGRDGEKEVLLGDAIISTALIQYDFVRQYDDKILRRNTLQDNLSRPNAEIRSFLAKYSGLNGYETLRKKTISYLEDLCAKNGFEKSAYPGADNDILYHPNYRHKHRDPDVCSVCTNCQGLDDGVCDAALESSCAELGCADRMTIFRARVDEAKGVAVGGRDALTDEKLREARKPFIHFGTIVSGDTVMKSGCHRDRIATREKAIAFEMEGAGVWDKFPTVVIKSVCDYADSHKNKMWQKYAAATAAACTKAFLGEWRKVS